MRRIVLLVVCVFLLTSLASFHPAQAAAFPIDYSDPASDVVRLNSTTNECVLDPAGACIKSPNPADVNIGSIHGRDGGTYLNFSIQVKGRIRDYANTSYKIGRAHV